MTFGFKKVETHFEFEIKSKGSRLVTRAEKKHMNQVAELGCGLCRRMGFEGTPAELHHPRAGMGMGQRASNMRVIPLCPEHHRGSTGVHGKGSKGFPLHWGFTEEDLLNDTLELLKK